MVKEINTIIFDIGGVIIKPHDPAYYQYLGRKSGRTEAEVHYMVAQLAPETETDRMTIPTFETLLSKQLGIPKKELKWMEFYKKHHEVNTDVVDLIMDLHDDFKVAYLSNIDKAKYLYTDKILESVPFDYRFASCNIKMRKPDKEIYQYVLKKMKANPQKTIFIDNMLVNVLAATNVGINSILFNLKIEGS
jgi:HAD superfamily hydrolase (TIGR01509 family)